MKTKRQYLQNMMENLRNSEHPKDKRMLEIFENRKKELISEKKHSKLGRNDPCLCGSGRKYKKCCIK